MWQTSEVFPLKYSLNNINGVEVSIDYDSIGISH